LPAIPLKLCVLHWFNSPLPVGHQWMRGDRPWESTAATRLWTGRCWRPSPRTNRCSPPISSSVWRVGRALMSADNRQRQTRNRMVQNILPTGPDQVVSADAPEPVSRFSRHPPAIATSMGTARHALVCSLRSFPLPAIPDPILTACEHRNRDFDGSATLSRMRIRGPYPVTRPGWNGA
jgi:hypothetical protein